MLKMLAIADMDVSSATTFAVGAPPAPNSGQRRTR